MGFNPRRFRFCAKNVDGGDIRYDYGDEKITAINRKVSVIEEIFMVKISKGGLCTQYNVKI